MVGREGEDRLSAQESLPKNHLLGLSDGQLLVEVSNRIVQEFRASVGKGPSKCNSYWAGNDVLVVVLRGGYSVAEQTLFEAGEERAVHDSQHALQNAMEGRLTQIVEDLTGRRVAGFLSASRQSPDLRAEVFVLEPTDPHGPNAAA